MTTVKAGGFGRPPLSEPKTDSRLTATREAATARLTRLGEKAEASGGVGPLVTLARRAGAHELVDRGAALTYYTVLSLIPGLLVLFSVIGLFGTESTVDEVLSIIDDVGPSSGETVAQGSDGITDQARRRSRDSCSAAAS